MRPFYAIMNRVKLTAKYDGSQTRIGTVLMQKGHPISFRVRPVRDAGIRYTQMENELLAKVFTREKFNAQASGRITTLQTKHKPLVTIVQMPISKAPRQIKAMFLRLQKYDL